MLTKHRKGLDLVALRLLEEETIDGPLVMRLVQEGLTESGTGTTHSSVDPSQADVGREPG